MDNQSKIELGSVICYFDLNFFDPESRIKVRRLGDAVADIFDRRGMEPLRSTPEGFTVGPYFVPITGIVITGIILDDGSIKTIIQVAAAVGSIVSGVASYSEAKEEIPIILEDVREVIENVARGEEIYNGDTPRPVDYAIDMKDEEDILEQIAKNGR